MATAQARAIERAAKVSAFIVVNGDVLTDLDLAQLVAFHEAHGADGTIALHQVEDPSAFGVVPTDDEGRVLGFVEKPPRDQAPTNWINAGTYVLEPSVLERIDPDRRVSIERETFPAIVADGGLWAVQSDCYWVDAGTPQSYIDIQFDLIDGVRGAAHKGIADSASIDESAQVDHSVVMAGASIGAGAVVRDSIISTRAQVAANAVVDGSIVGPDAVVEAGAKLTGLTMLGDGAVAPAGAILDGMKIPEAD